MASQHPAITVVEARAERNAKGDAARRQHLLGVDFDRDTDELASGVRSNGRITLNFHPDRIAIDGNTVASGLLSTGSYRPQSETGISNGMRFAAPGGARTRWETALFGGVYDDEALPRPVYGALDLLNDPHGGSPRFGSSFVVLEPSGFDRATFCVGDSHVGPQHVGTITEFTSIIAGLFEQRSNNTPQLLRALETGVELDDPARDLDTYVEVQVHGGVNLADDVQAIVLDPSFVSTDVEAALSMAADRYNFALEWHGGSELAAVDVPADFRGSTMPALAHRVARLDGFIDAAAIGRAASAVGFTQPHPDGDQPDSELQQYKYLWHCLLQFGHDTAST